MKEYAVEEERYMTAVSDRGSMTEAHRCEQQMSIWKWTMEGDMQHAR